eukprot:scaffold24077_cov65-Phaeocystis_antarctica.AAC.6
MSTSARTSEYTSSRDCTSTSPTTRRTSCSSTSSREEAICSHRKDCSAGSPSTSMSATGGSSCPSSSESTSAVVVLRMPADSCGGSPTAQKMCWYDGRKRAKGSTLNLLCVQ